MPYVALKSGSLLHELMIGGASVWDIFTIEVLIYSVRIAISFERRMNASPNMTTLA